jgi:hypothetical protein
MNITIFRKMIIAQPLRYQTVERRRFDYIRRRAERQPGDCSSTLHCVKYAVRVYSRFAASISPGKHHRIIRPQYVIRRSVAGMSCATARPANKIVIW